MGGKSIHSQLESQTESHEQIESPSESAGQTELKTYQLTCLSCSYAPTVEGVKSALKASMDHEENHGDDHFVELELIEE